MAKPYRILRTFVDPDGDFGDRRGMVVGDAQDNLYFVDAMGYDDGKWKYLIGPLRYKKLSGVPAEGKRGKVNPHEWEEVQTFFAGDVSKTEKEELRELLDNPQELSNPPRLVLAFH